MRGFLRVVILEDNPDDAEQVLHELHRAGFAPIWQRVQTEQDYLVCLDSVPDLILADFALPHFDALRALHLLQERDLDIPFIIVTGTINEEVAVECMKQGAADYLLKDRLARLGQAVKRATEEKELRDEKRQAEASLRESEERFRSVAESASDAITCFDSRGNIVFWNPAAEAIFGFPAGEVLGKDFALTVPERLRAGQRAMLNQFVARGVLGLGGRPVEGVGLRRDGKEFPAEGSLAIWQIRGEMFFTAIVRDISERKQVERELQSSLEKSRRAVEGMIEAMAMTVEMRDPYTAGHQRRVAQLADATAKEMRLSEDIHKGARIAAVIHDIGKISVPAEILSKPGRLTEFEFGIIQTHPQVGHQILQPIEFSWPIAEIVHQHHERMDGSGYPRGLQGDNILMEARVLAVADVVEAMASHRPYRPALGVDIAVAEIARGRGTWYDANVVDACLRVLTSKEFHFVEA